VAEQHHTDIQPPATRGEIPDQCMHRPLIRLFSSCGVFGSGGDVDIILHRIPQKEIHLRQSTGAFPFTHTAIGNKMLVPSTN
jgi:hypothetical protein